MIDWKVILFILLLVGFIGIIWFFTIKDMVKHFHYLKSQKITNRANNDDCYNEPEPVSVGMVEQNNCLNSLADKPNDTHYTKGDNRCFPSPINICLIRHILKSIIKRLIKLSIQPFRNNQYSYRPQQNGVDNAQSCESAGKKENHVEKEDSNCNNCNYLLGSLPITHKGLLPPITLLCYTLESIIAKVKSRKQPNANKTFSILSCTTPPKSSVVISSVLE